MDRLLPAILPSIDFPRALYRGWYMSAVAVVEWHGVPLNAWWLKRLRKHWEESKARAIVEVDKDFGVYEGGSFREDHFWWIPCYEGVTVGHYLKSGNPELTDEVFREMSRIIPEIAPLRELRHMLSGSTSQRAYGWDRQPQSLPGLTLRGKDWPE